MPRDTRVFIVEDDLFARNWMDLLLVRDWRTRVAGDAGTLDGLASALKASKGRVDIILFDTDIPHNDRWLVSLLEELHTIASPPRILLTGLAPDEKLLRQSLETGYIGYLIKEEIRHSLAWACTLGSEGRWVTTPRLQILADRMGLRLPPRSVVLDGRRVMNMLTEREAEMARLAFLYSVERHDLADELSISQDWTYGLISSLYKKLGLEEILSGEVDPSLYLGNNPLVLDHVKGILERLKGSKKGMELETLAFHLITTPEIEELP